MALTPSQIRQHIGQMLDDVTSLPAARAFLTDTQWQKMISGCVHYINNGTLGTLADRKEAMKSFARSLYTRLTGLSPDTATHNYREHFLAEPSSGNQGLFRLPPARAHAAAPRR